MEPGIREFFKRLSASIGLFIFWVAINMTIGVKYEFAFFENRIQLGNILFYTWVITSFMGLLYAYYRIWQKPIDNLHD